jgi:ATP-binding cassette subfamily B protein
MRNKKNREVAAMCDSAKEHKAKIQIRTLSKALPEYLKPYKNTIILMLCSVFLAAFSVLFIGHALSYFIDKALSAGKLEGLSSALLMLSGAVTILTGASAARYYYTQALGVRVVADMRQHIFQHLMYVPINFFDQHKSSELVSQLSTDTSLIQTMIGGSISVAMRNVIMLFCGLGMLLYTSPKLSLIMLFLLPILIVCIMLFARRLKGDSREIQHMITELFGKTGEIFRNIQMVKSYNNETFETENHHGQSQKIIDKSLKQTFIRALFTSFVIASVFGSIGIILFVGGKNVIEGSMTAGQLGTFIFTSALCAGAFGSLTEIFGELQKAANAMERIEALLKLPHENKKGLVGFSGANHPRIKFSDVAFFYPNDKHKPVLNNISFEILPGKINAIVGPSGSGKSTILKLLLRFYEAQSGSITINSQDINDYDIQDLRHQFAYVSQDPYIFSSSVYDNIAYAKPQAQSEEIIDAARLANALGFIENLPEGFDTLVGENGIKLSGGQKQRISIARAILKNPQILLLDEATSALDSQNEQAIRKALHNLMQDRTTIVISHRLSTVKNADRIIVIEDGKIGEIGRHDELVRLGGTYKKLANIQLAEANDTENTKLDEGTDVA